MYDSTYPNIGRFDSFSKGYYVRCQFGYPYLVCKPIDKPDDPLLHAPLAQFVTCLTYGEQFLQHLHQWKNPSDIIDILFCYYVNDAYQHTNQNKAEIINVLASALQQGQLLVIPLDNDE